MIIIGYGPILNHKVVIPDFCITEDKNKLSKDGSLEPSLDNLFSECTNFELSDDKWFAYDNGLIVRFPKSKEWDWRTKKAEGIVSTVSRDPFSFNGPEARLLALETAAYLCGFSLAELIARLEKAKNDGEDLVDTFNRVKDDK